MQTMKIFNSFRPVFFAFSPMSVQNLVVKYCFVEFREEDRLSRANNLYNLECYLAV